jgi:hypothetical protein
VQGWYELTHDRLIKPIIDSNIEWKDEREKEKEKIFTKLWQKAIAARVRTSSLNQSENEDQVLGAFYETVVKESIQKTGIHEDQLRNWCESTLITPRGNRGVVHEENGRIGDLF